MSRADRPYFRGYLDLADDPRFADVWEEATLGAFYMLTVAAEQAWPSSADLPRRVTDESFARLERAGIVTRLPGDRFDLADLDSERAARSEAGRKAAEARWSRRAARAMRPHSASNAEAMRIDAQDEDEDEDERVSSRDARADVAALLERWPKVTAKQRATLDEILGRHDVTGPEWAAAVIRETPPDADPLAAVMTADRTYQAERLAQADADEAAWSKTKAADRTAAGRFQRTQPATAGTTPATS